MRIRIPEMLAQRHMTPYALSKKSGGRISLSTAYRINRNRGRAHTFDAELLEALCDVLGIGPGELFEREPKKPVVRRKPQP
jgi:DNA-binding Xre family transcriptional regulator